MTQLKSAKLRDREGVKTYFEIDARVVHVIADLVSSPGPTPARSRISQLHFSTLHHEHARPRARQATRAPATAHAHPFICALVIMFGPDRVDAQQMANHAQQSATQHHCTSTHRTQSRVPRPGTRWSSSKQAAPQSDSHRRIHVRAHTHKYAHFAQNQDAFPSLVYARANALRA